MVLAGALLILVGALLGASGWLMDIGVPASALKTTPILNIILASDKAFRLGGAGVLFLSGSTFIAAGLLRAALLDAVKSLPPVVTAGNTEDGVVRPPANGHDANGLGLKVGDRVYATGDGPGVVTEFKGDTVVVAFGRNGRRELKTQYVRRA